ncbi:MAG TPA: polysaccharide biosynthesis C-terminal domain-containing protein [Saprospiraceae bacterium]|nr:polysaccharide biosynthesis C-terminal domain-containing protein [Saprospiraceae bacterium]
MSNLVKKLAGETVLYGMSSIVGRLLNYLLVPLHTRLFAEAEYGVVSHLFALSAFLIVIFSYRMESAFFRFGTPAEDRERAYSTGLLSLLASSLLITAALFAFAQPVADVLQYPQHPEYIRWFALILAFDCLCELPFARLRLEQRPIRFVTAKIFNIGLNVALNLFWLLFCPWAAREGQGWVHALWSPDRGVAYVFLANVIASIATFLLLLPQVGRIRWTFDWQLWKRMLAYAAPLIVVGLAGIMDEMFSRAMMPRLLTGTLEENRAQLGIFAANYKLAMLISLFTQAYRYAAEPFFFRHAADRDALRTQADATKWFTIAASAGMLGILLFLDVLKRFIDVRYYGGLQVVPILLMANLFLGLYYNFSVWYRLKDRTMLGAAISVAGAVLTVALNILWIPRFGYVGAAWVTLLCYVFMSWATWFTGRKPHPVPYPLGRMALYVVLALALYALGRWAAEPLRSYAVLLWAMRAVLFGAYLGLVYLLERRRAPLAGA